MVSSELALRSPHLFWLPRHAAVADVDASIARVDADLYRSATGLVFRTEEDLRAQLQLEAGELADRLARRAPLLPVFLLGYDKEERRLSVERLTRDGIESLEEQASAAAALRDHDLRELLRETADSSYFRATQAFHLVTPAYRHTSLFVRVGNSVRDREKLERIAFWLLPEVANADALLLDTWSIAAPVLRAMQLAGVEVPFDAARIHPTRDRSAASESIDRLLSQLRPDQRLTCLISISGSGSFQEVVGEILGERARIVSVFKFANAPAETRALSVLDESVESYDSEEECEWCQSKASAALPLDPRLYYVSKPVEREVPLRAEHFTGRRFIEAYRSFEGVLTVHRDDPNDGRHHALDVDVLELLEHSNEFNKRFRRVLFSLGFVPDVVVTPDHSAGRRLGRIASGLFDADLVIHNNLRDAAGISSRDKNAVRSAADVLVVDDVLNSGTRLINYNRALREECGAFARIAFVVGVARPDSEQRLAQRERELTTRHSWSSQLLFVEKLVLPHWKANECPWCLEYDLLSRVSGAIAEPPSWMIARLSLLSERERGLRESPLLLPLDVASPTLGAGSLVGPEGFSALQTLFSIASALQELRSAEDPKRRLDPNFPASRVFAERNLNNYSEGLLRAAFLRLVRPCEWSEATSAARGRFFRDCMGEPGQSAWHGELLVSADRGLGCGQLSR